MPRSPFESLPACSGMVQRRANAKPCSLSHRRGRGVWFVWFISRIFENYDRTMTVSLVLGFTSRTISFDLLQLSWRRGEMAFCSQCLRRWSQLCDLEADVATLPTQPRKRSQRSPTFYGLPYDTVNCSRCILTKRLHVGGCVSFIEDK
jgi:hypothetical protein